METRLCVALIAAASLGCASLGLAPAGLLTPAGGVQGSALVSTTTELSQANYRVVRTGVEGESRGLVLLVFFTVVAPSHATALERLYEAAGLEPGGPWALANVAVEQPRRNFLLFALPRVRVRADVVEFVPPSEPGSGPGPQ